MNKHHNLPFKVGQLAEARSFQSGFRGAWFRCKIKDISWRNGDIKHALEYFDFPDEKVKWTKLYQLPPSGGKSKVGERHLMVRPQYPPLYQEGEISDINAISEVVVMVDGVWKVGDFVDWWTDGCHWSGTVTRLLGNNKVKIQLPPPPAGEGASYEVSCDDLRPSLHWDPEHGWTVPASKEGEISHHCVRIIQQVNHSAAALDLVTKGVPSAAGSPFNASSSYLSENSESTPIKSKRSILPKQSLSRSLSKDTARAGEASMDLDAGDCGPGKASCSDSVSSSHVRNASLETAGQSSGKDLSCCHGAMKRLRTSGSIFMNSMCSDTLEAAILDLEELANKIKWLKHIIEFGMPVTNTVRPPWKFVEHRAASTPK